MKALIISFLLFLKLFAMDDPQILMDTISHHAMRIGDGQNKVYAFIDPMCSSSQAYISLISTRKDLQRKSSYYIFLYRLPKFDSDALIRYIYQSPEPVSTLLFVIRNKDYYVPFEFEATQETEKKIKEIADIAKEMKMKRRPYLLLFDNGSKYCRVSEGTAPCLEDNDLI